MKADRNFALLLIGEKEECRGDEFAIVMQKQLLAYFICVHTLSYTGENGFTQP
jgi:hypothetical protein